MNKQTTLRRRENNELYALAHAAEKCGYEKRARDTEVEARLIELGLIEFVAEASRFRLTEEGWAAYNCLN